MVATGINTDRWRHYLRDMNRVLRPGGWCQVVEIYFQAQSDNGSLTDGEQRPHWRTADNGLNSEDTADQNLLLEDNALRRWSKLYLQGIGQYKDPRAPGRMEALIKSAGFTEIETSYMQLPMCDWPTGTTRLALGRIRLV